MPITLAEVMTPEPRTLRPDATLLDAIQLLHEQRFRHIPVATDDGRLLGVVTDRDIKRASPSPLASEQHQVWERVVRETPLARVMTREPITATPGTTVRAALDRFVDDKIGCLPVLEDGRLVGIVTAHDLFRAMRTLLGG